MSGFEERAKKRAEQRIAQQKNRSLLAHFFANESVGIKDAITHADDLYNAGESAVGEPVLDANGNPTGFFVTDRRLSVLETDNKKRRILTLKLH